MCCQNILSSSQFLSKLKLRVSFMFIFLFSLISTKSAKRQCVLRLTWWNFVLFLLLLFSNKKKRQLKKWILKKQKRRQASPLGQMKRHENRHKKQTLSNYSPFIGTIWSYSFYISMRNEVCRSHDKRLSKT